MATKEPETQTPGDDTQPAKRKGKRRRVLPDGDYAVFVIQDDGALAPVSELGRATFATEEEARSWLKQHGSALIEQTGQQLKLAIIAFKALVTLQIQQEVKVSLSEKAKHAVNEETGEYE